MSKNGVTITALLGPELFRFDTKQHWVNKGRSWFGPYSREETICLDARGRIVTNGAHFSRAEQDGSYPVVVHLIDPAGEPRVMNEAQMRAEIRRRAKGGMR